MWCTRHTSLPQALPRLSRPLTVLFPESGWGGSELGPLICSAAVSSPERVSEWRSCAVLTRLRTHHFFLVYVLAKRAQGHITLMRQHSVVNDLLMPESPCPWGLLDIPIQLQDPSAVESEVGEEKGKDRSWYRTQGNRKREGSGRRKMQGGQCGDPGPARGSPASPQRHRHTP